MTDTNLSSNTPSSEKVEAPKPPSEPVKSFRLSSTKPVIKPWLNVKFGFSFGFFAFLISPIILFQSVLFFLFLLVLEPTTQGSSSTALTDLNFLLNIAQLLFFSILLFIAINLLVAALGVLFDKQRLWAIMALVLTTVSLGLVFIAPRLIEWKTTVTTLF